MWLHQKKLTFNYNTSQVLLSGTGWKSASLPSFSYSCVWSINSCRSHVWNFVLICSFTVHINTTPLFHTQWREMESWTLTINKFLVDIEKRLRINSNHKTNVIFPFIAHQPEARNWKFWISHTDFISSQKFWWCLPQPIIAIKLCILFCVIFFYR